MSLGWLRPLAAWTVVAFGVRGAVTAGLALMPRMYQLTSPEALWGMAALMAWLLLANAAWQICRRWPVQGTPRRLVIGGVVAVVTVWTLGRFAWFHHTGHVFAWSFTHGRELGAFPYAAGTVNHYEVQGRPTTAQIDATGVRTCGPGQTGELRVGLIGDSFVFGKGVEDDETLCWKLREQFATTHPGAVTFINLGQPGANHYSHADTLRWAAEAHDLDAAFVGLLFPDDANVIDVNRQHGLAQRTVAQLFGALLDPEVIIDSFPIFLQASLSDLAMQAVLDEGMHQVGQAAEDTGVPTWLYFYSDVDVLLRHYVGTAEQMSHGSDVVHSLGMLRPDDDEAAFIAGDGHPSEVGNVWYANVIGAVVKAELLP